ncbi:nonribosomal peptide synthetase [Rhexocercosporidium sp. MPI-PUGE-AT-0058]|nr:nonribosomal peptide synthetase [Rhexocercosporidium sp. MPI-PUGE-AT-0058]
MPDSGCSCVTPKSALQNVLHDNVCEEFWREYLQGAEATTFPQISATVHQAQRTAEEERWIGLRTGNASRRLNPSAGFIHTAWALLLGKYTDSQDVAIVSGTSFPGQNFQEVLLLPIRFKMGSEVHTRNLVQQADEIARKTMSSNKLIPQYAAEFAKMASNSVLIIQSESQTKQLLRHESASGWPSSICALLLHCAFSESGVQIRAQFDPVVIHLVQVQRLLRQLDHVVQQLLSSEDILAGNVDFISPEDQQEIALLNSGAGTPDACIHDLILEHVRTRPDAPAVNAHDGDFTYGDLDGLATKLSKHLVDLGVGFGTFVPTLFEKSKWTQVAVMAILKAGGAFVMLDPAHPPNRNRLICQKVRASIALASPSSHHVLRTADGPDIIVLNEDLISSISVSTSTTPLPTPTPSTCAYVLFTSGSTGMPKGALLEHRSFAAAACNIARTTNMSPQTRTLQFGSYSFGAAVVEIFTTLIAGGCVCVPSDMQRMSGDLPAFTTTYRVNWAFMTPSLARTIDPAALPSLKVLVTGGEAITPDLLLAWAPQLDLYTVYGSAEQSSIAAMAGPLVVGQSGGAAEFGRPFPGNYMWLIDPDDPERLVPVGCVGELVLEGPLVARGYLDEPEKTTIAFPQNFGWRNAFAKHPDGTMRFYRTGDLVRYGVNGVPEFVARKDGYIKLRGQRIELGEIEFQLKRVMDSPLDLCVEVVVPENGKHTDDAALVAFIALGAEYESDDDDQARDRPSLQNKKLLAEHLGPIEEQLRKQLPEHMIPRLFFPLRILPVTVSGKILHRTLRERGAQLSVKQLAELSLHRTCQTEPSSEMEKYLQSVWSQLLGIPMSSISAGDSFIAVGGDSLKVIKLFTRLRDDGYEIDVPGILAAPMLSEMALKCHQAAEAGEWADD